MVVYAYDAEFLEHGPTRPISLISIGIVASDGRELYLQYCYADWATIQHLEDPWLKENVLPYLDHFNMEQVCPDWGAILDERRGGHFTTPWRTREQMRLAIFEFMNPDVHGPIEKMVGYFPSYDHVVFCQIFGRMIDLPKGFKQWTWCLKQWASDHGIEYLGRHVPHDPTLDGPEHRAISDARWTMRAYQWAMAQTGVPNG